MTSKTFKSTMTDSRELEVDVIFSNPRLLIKESGNGRSGFVFAPSDAPALALAILEAAGYKEEQGNETTEAAHHFGMSMLHLRLGIKEQEYITAEAEAQAELEAEAFNLYRAYMDIHEPMNAIGDWHMLAEHTKENWLAVARRARELAKEATK